ncbi:CCA-adding enzyme [Thalassobacillus devorans]|uniref:CCA-adding enzyme n=1 Tax=Thalassobacillus devorans TaxID=279813 RepID=A0ABQ1NZE2_9BACI|nr:CCA tRNA nucleotidyltransferase [Thalassobacillus devorans]NIK28284.1 tRNA nucleotidyltransferase (CCA-adding enzyme) [Thalassobacillus devorans]GGC87455.1 CCA-adding enzyme [Thalassobacillus devorans]
MNVNITQIPAFQQALPVLERIEKHGFQAFFVGGSVRDALIGKDIVDVDIASSATPQDIKTLFKKVIPVGIEHGTVIIRYEGQSYEVTTFRSESGYEDHRHPDKVEFVTDIELDLARRDFTINAMALNRDGRVMDPFEGLQAIKDKKIQAVGDPLERFEEDPLRIMRAIRFSSQLGFHIEKNTSAAILKQGEWLKEIAVERIAVEFEKLFRGEYLIQAVEACKQSGIHRFFPVFKQYPFLFDYAKGITYPLDDFAELISFFVFYHPEVTVDDWVKQWKLSRRLKYNAKAYVEALEQYKLRGLDEWLVYNMPPHLDKGFIRLVGLLFPDMSSGYANKLTSIRKNLVITDRSEIELSAAHLMEMFPDVPKGPWIGELLVSLEKKVVSMELANDYNEIKEWVQAWNPPGKD